MMSARPFNVTAGHRRPGEDRRRAALHATIDFLLAAVFHISVDYSSRDLLPPWKRDNGQRVERVVVYDPRSLAQVWVADEVTGGYVAVPYRVPHPDMTPRRERGGAPSAGGAQGGGPDGATAVRRPGGDPGHHGTRQIHHRQEEGRTQPASAAGCSGRQGGAAQAVRGRGRAPREYVARGWVGCDGAGRGGPGPARRGLSWGVGGQGGGGAVP